MVWVPDRVSRMTGGTHPLTTVAPAVSGHVGFTARLQRRRGFRAPHPWVPTFVGKTEVVGPGPVSGYGVMFLRREDEERRPLQGGVGANETGGLVRPPVWLLCVDPHPRSPIGVGDDGCRS